MDDNAIPMQKFLLWWQQNLAVLYVLVGSVVFGLLAMLWYAYEPATMAAVWGMTHGHEAKLQGAAVKLPAGWREDNGAAHADLHLVKPHAWREKVETVDVDGLSGADADFERRMNTLRSLEKMAVADGDVAAEYPLSAANAARFVCMEHANRDLDTLHVTCLQRDGRRVVRMVGSESSRPDFAGILTALTGVK